MIVHKNTCRIISGGGPEGNANYKTKWMFEAEYDAIVNGRAYFSDVNNNNTYRLDFSDQDELRELIEDLIELYNSREGDK